MTSRSSTEPELVNPVTVDDVPGWARSMATTFLHNREGPRMEAWVGDVQAGFDPHRTWGARIGERWLATLRTVPRTLSVPTGPEQAAEVAVDALTNVTVADSHRRRGLMSRMLTGSLAAARDRGDAFSALIAAEWPIYGRFGYAPATVSADYVLQRRRAGAECPGDPTRVRQVEREEFGALAPEVFAAAGRRRAGQIDRDADWWKRQLGLDGGTPRGELPNNWFVHDGEEGVDGVLAWSADGTPSLAAPAQSVEVWLLSSATDLAYRNLWAYLTGIDGVDRIRLVNRPAREPVQWMLGDGRALQLSQMVDFLWLRILDVPAALMARRYPIDGDLVLEVRDEALPSFAAGRYRLTAGPDGVECVTTDAAADLELSQRTLASIYLGGFRLRELRPAAAILEHSPGALDRLDLMFSTALAPWNPTWF